MYKITLQIGCATAFAALIPSSVLHAQGEFRVSAHVPGLYPAATVAADFDGDGDVDLLAREAVQPFAPGGWRLLRNRGDGNFDAPFANFPGSDHQPRLVFDVDGDSDLDVIGVRNALTGDTIQVAANDGTGRFQTVSITPLLQTTQVRSGDLDGDGDLDVLALNQVPGPAFTVLRNQSGTLVFEAPVSIAPLNLGDFHLVDVDGDRDPDVLAVLDARELLLFENAGTGAFGVPLRSPLPADTSLLDVGDVDRDGDVDLLISTGAFDPVTTARVRLFQLLANDGTGAFAPPRLLFFLPEGAILPDRARLTDLDADGDLDVLVQSLDGMRSARQGALGLFQLDTLVPTSFTLADGTFHLADLDGDGDVDLVGGERGAVDALRTLSNGTFGLVAQFPFNEVRGRTIANAVSDYPARPAALASRSDARRDPNRPSFRGPDAGTGCIGHDLGVSVETGVEVSASHGVTWMFWVRERRANPVPVAQSRVFTQFGASGLGYECYVQGNQLIFAMGSVRASTNAVIGGQPNVWHHVTLTLDPATSQVQFWRDGVAEPAQSPGFLGQPFTGTLRIAPAGFSQRSATEWLDLDDFRVYQGIVTASVIQDAQHGERTSISPQGNVCAGVSGPLAIGWLPNFGIGSTNEVRLEVARAAGSRPLAFLGIGLSQTSWGGIPLPIPISTYCDLAITPDLILSPSADVLAIDSWMGTFHLPLPVDPALFDAHVHAQGVALFFQANEITTSETLDLSLKLR